MKQIFALLCLSLAAWPAVAASAFFTGRMHQVQTAKHEVGWNCQYNNAGKTFWRTFPGSCPPHVKV